MRIRLLRAFLALHRLGTVAAAAEAVFQSPAAVSVQLKELERELGMELFHRTGRSLRLTSAAHRLVPLAEQMCALHEQMRGLGGGTAAMAGLLRLGVIGSALGGVLPALLQRMTHDHPRLDIKVIAGNSAELLEQVEAGVLDAALVTHAPERLPAEVRAQVLYSEPYVLLTPSTDAPADLAAALATAPYVAFDRSTWAGRLIDEYLLRHGLRQRPAMELNSLEAIAAVVRHGLGVSIVPLIRGAAWRQGSAMGMRVLPQFDRPVALIERRSAARPWLAAAMRAALQDVEAPGD